MAVQQNKSLVPLVTCVVRTTRSSSMLCQEKSTVESTCATTYPRAASYRGRKVVDKGSDE